MRNWIVELIKPPKHNYYAFDFFPRYFHYKSDAVKLKEEIEKNGGKAEVNKNLIFRNG